MAGHGSPWHGDFEGTVTLFEPSISKSSRWEQSRAGCNATPPPSRDRGRDRDTNRDTGRDTDTGRDRDTGSPGCSILRAGHHFYLGCQKHREKAVVR